MFTLNWSKKIEALEQRLKRAPLLEEWSHTPGGLTSQLRADGSTHFLVSPKIGVIEFNLHSRQITVCPHNGVDPGIFERVMAHEWLPLVYQAWGYQVLHCSAAVRLSTAGVLAFAGPAGSGKSTLGYALGERPGWQQIADESLAMEEGAGSLRLAPIPNYVRLRPASAAHFDVESYAHARLAWPDAEMRLEKVCFLQPWPEDSVRVQPLSGADAYRLFLGQAFAMTLKQPEHNKELLRAYLQIASQVPAYRLSYGKSFSILDQVLDLATGLGA